MDPCPLNAPKLPVLHSPSLAQLSRGQILTSARQNTGSDPHLQGPPQPGVESNAASRPRLIPGPSHKPSLDSIHSSLPCRLSLSPAPPHDGDGDRREGNRKLTPVCRRLKSDHPRTCIFVTGGDRVPSPLPRFIHQQTATTNRLFDSRPHYAAVTRPVSSVPAPSSTMSRWGKGWIR